MTEAKPPVVGYILRLLWRHEVLELVFSEPTLTLKPVISIDFRNLLFYIYYNLFCLSLLFKKRKERDWTREKAPYPCRPPFVHSWASRVSRPTFQLLIRGKDWVVQLIAWGVTVTHILLIHQTKPFKDGYSVRASLKRSPLFCHTFLSISIRVYWKRNLHASQRIPTKVEFMLYYISSFPY